jgi:putative ABC transport system permease protein
MLKILKLGLLNALRNKRRSLITMIMVTFGMIVIIFISGFFNTIVSGLKNQVIQADTGDLQIMATGYKEKKTSGSLDYTIKNVSQLIAELKTEPEIAAVTKRIDVGGLLSNGKQSVYSWGYGVDLATVEATLPLLLKDPNSKRKFNITGQDGAIIGAGLAKKLNAVNGVSIFLVTNDKYGSINSANIMVSDIIKYRTDAENDSKIIMTDVNAEKLLGLEDEATEVSIKLKDPKKVGQLKSKFYQKYQSKYNIQFYAWYDLLGGYGQIIAMFQGIQFIILFIMAIVVLIGVINTILMSVFERTSEIGSLMALGSSRGRIIAIFMAESFWIGLLGILGGTVLGIFILLLSHIQGIPFSAPGTPQAVFIKPTLTPGIVFIPAISLLFISICAGIYPSRFAARLDPIEAIRKN